MKCGDKLPRAQMLKVRAEISGAFKHGVNFKGDYVRILAVPPGVIRNNRQAANSAGVITDKRVKFAAIVNKKCGIAVRRNRIKRVAREYFRTHQENFIGLSAAVFVFDKKVEDEILLKSELDVLAEKCRKSIDAILGRAKS
jgi:ribonuclease P protein component